MNVEPEEDDGRSIGGRASDMCELACELCFEIELLKEPLKDDKSGKRG